MTAQKAELKSAYEAEVARIECELQEQMLEALVQLQEFQASTK